MTGKSYKRKGTVMTFEARGTAQTKIINPVEKTGPSPVYEDEILDWDCALETPPRSRRSGTVNVVLRKAQSNPSPVETD